MRTDGPQRVRVDAGPRAAPPLRYSLGHQFVHELPSRSNEPPSRRPTQGYDGRTASVDFHTFTLINPFGALMSMMSPTLAQKREPTEIIRRSSRWRHLPRARPRSGSGVSSRPQSSARPSRSRTRRRDAPVLVDDLATAEDVFEVQYSALDLPCSSFASSYRVVWLVPFEALWIISATSRRAREVPELAFELSFPSRVNGTGCRSCRTLTSCAGQKKATEARCCSVRMRVYRRRDYARKRRRRGTTA